MSKLDELLSYLEKNLDPNHIDNTIELQKKCLNYDTVDHLTVKVGYPIQGFEAFPVSETHVSPEKMMYNELLSCVGGAQIKDNSLPMIRANYGVGTLPSFFGLKCAIINNNMPWVEHAKNEDEIQKIIEKGIPDLNSGFGGKISETHEFYREKLSKYPICNEYIRIYHPDLQGPFDVAHLIWGSDIYLAMYDTPELIHSLLELITKTYVKLMKHVKNEINDEIDNYNFHWGQLYKGKITLRNDSAINLSKDMYMEFVQKYDEQILNEFGTGSMHYCGRADHLVFDMAQTKGVVGMNYGYMSNVEFGEAFLDQVYDKFTDLRRPIISYHLTEEEYNSFNRQRFSTGITVQTWMNSKEDAIKFVQKHL